VHQAGVMRPQLAKKLAQQSQRDAHSVVGDALFIDPANGDFRVQEGSPALALGFKNFPMDRFGVQKPELKAIARTPEIPWVQTAGSELSTEQLQTIWQARLRSIAGLGDQSAYGLPEPSGVLLVEVPAESKAARAGLREDDVIVACNGKSIKSVSDLKGILAYATDGKLKLEVIRRQQLLSLDLAN
jgi:membrane-associated protease RseP (regulator of RpoE activity)